MKEKLKEMLAAHPNTASSVFWSAFCERENPIETSLDDCLTGFFLEKDAPYPLEKLSPYDQLLAYGVLMVDLGRKKLLLEEIPLEDQENSSVKTKLGRLEKHKTTFLAKSPWLTEIDQAQGFPTELMPTLATGLRLLSEIEIQDALEIAGCTPESLFTVEEWVTRYQKGAIYNDYTELCKLCLVIRYKTLNSVQIKSLVKALENDNKIKKLFLEGNQLTEKGIEILYGSLNKFHISTLSILGINVKSLNLLIQRLQKNTSLEFLDLSHCGITDIDALNLFKALKTSHIKELSLASNPISFEDNNITDLLAEGLGGNTSLTSLNLRGCQIRDKGTLALFKTLKLCSITKLNLSWNAHIVLYDSEEFEKALKNNTLMRLNLSDNDIRPNDNLKKLIKYCLKPNTTLIELSLAPGDLAHLPTEVQQKIDALISRNKSYLKAHRKINKCLVAVREAISNPAVISNKAVIPSRCEESPSSFAVIPSEREESPATGEDLPSQKTLLEMTTQTTLLETHLTKALEEARNLYYAVPRYAHAEKLLHQVYFEMGMSYAKFGDYIALIALYFHHFISHPDSTIDSALGKLLTHLEDKLYQAAGLTLKDKDQLIFSLSKEAQSIKPDTLLAQALQASRIPRQQLLKKLFVTPFHMAIQKNPNYAVIPSECEESPSTAGDLSSQTKLLEMTRQNELSPFEINLIFSTATDTEITEYFDYLKNSWTSEEEKTEFLNLFSTANWSRFLNQLNLETLSTFNLAALGKISGELREALVDWLIIQLKSPSPEFLTFARKQKLFSIPHLSNLILKDNEIQKQLIEYGVFMGNLGREIERCENSYFHEADLESFQAKLTTFENKKTRFISSHPWLRLIHDERVFPTNLFPVLKDDTSLWENGIGFDISFLRSLLRKTECLPPPSISQWAKKHIGSHAFSDNHLNLNKTPIIHITLEEIRQLSQILKSNTSLLKLTLPIKSKINITYLTEGLKNNTTLQVLDLSYSKLDSEKVMILAELLKKNNTICELNLSHSNLSYKAVEILTDALKTNTGLKKLILDHSELGNTGVTLLAKAFENTQTLTDISLANNGIGTNGIQSLAKATSLKKLDSLNLNDNKLALKDAERFSEVLSPNALASLKSKLKIEKARECLAFFNKNYNSRLEAKIIEIEDSTIRMKGWLGQDVIKNKNKCNAIRGIMRRIGVFFREHNSINNIFDRDSETILDTILDTTLQAIYGYIRDRKDIICASTRSDDDWLSWFPRGKVDSVSLFNEIIAKFLEYDADLEANYLKSKLDIFPGH